MPRVWSVLKEGLAAPNSASPPGGGTRSPAKRRSLRKERLTGDSSSQRCGPTGWGDGDSCLGGGRCLKSAYEG